MKTRHSQASAARTLPAAIPHRAGMSKQSVNLTSAIRQAPHCVCGGGCPRCRGPQPKLAVGAADDRYEREADRVARQVTDPAVNRADAAPPRTTPLVQAKAEGPGTPAMAGGTERRIADAVGGEPLSASVRAFMEPRLGADLGRVRVHRDAGARELNDDLNARAFTYGSHIWFGASETPDDRALLVHELTHVLQQGSARQVQRAPRMAGQDWKVDHADVAKGVEKDLLIDAIAGLTGESAAVAGAYVGVVVTRATWRTKAPLYVRAIDFLRDNRAQFDVVDPWDTVACALDFCDASSATAASLTDAFYTQLLAHAVYGAGSGTATFRHSSGSVHHVPGRLAGSTEFAPSMRDSLLRPAATPSAKRPTGGFPAATNLLVSYGAQPGAVSSKSASALISKAGSRVPSRLRPFLEKLATDGTINVVLDRFLGADRGSFKLQPVGLGGAHYTNTRPPSIEVDPDLFPGSGVADREETEIGLRTTLSHELYHYALDRADAALSEIGEGADHELIAVVEERYHIVQLILAGQPPMADDIHAMYGFAGTDPKPALKGYLAANDAAGLKSYVRGQDFIDSLVYTMLVTPVTTNEMNLGKGGSVKDFLFDPAQITDLAYLAAINAVIIRKAFEIAADVASRTKTPFASVWSRSDYQAEIGAFLSKFIALAGSNRTA